MAETRATIPSPPRNLTGNEPGPRLNLHMQQLAYLRELERAGTITEAARRLGVSQPALSHALSELERRLGVALLERDGRRRVFTEAGRELARFAAEVLGRAAELEAWLSEQREGRAGVLRVGMIDAASLYVLPPAIAAFRAAHAAVKLRVVVETSGELLRRLARFELDLAFVVGPVAAEFESEPLLSEPLYIYAPPGTPPASDLPLEDWALYPSDSQTRSIIDEGLARRNLRPRASLESGNPQVLRQMVALGVGWSILPAAVAEAGETPLIRHSDAVVAVRTLYAVRRGSAPVDARASAFVELAYSTATSDVGGELRRR